MSDAAPLRACLRIIADQLYGELVTGELTRDQLWGLYKTLDRAAGPRIASAPNGQEMILVRVRGRNPHRHVAVLRMARSEFNAGLPKRAVDPLGEEFDVLFSHEIVGAGNVVPMLPRAASRGDAA